MKKEAPKRMSEDDELRIMLELFGKEVVKRYKAKGMRQKDFIIATGISQSKMSDIENGKGNPTFKTIHLIARKLDITLSIIFRDKGFNKKHFIG